MNISTGLSVDDRHVLDAYGSRSVNMPSRRKNLIRARRKRVRDFVMRRAADSGNPPPLAGYECVMVHPLADDTEILAKIGWSPERCLAVDVYWRIGDDVVLLQVCSAWPGGSERVQLSSALTWCFCPSVLDPDSAGSVVHSLRRKTMRLTCALPAAPDIGAQKFEITMSRH